MDSIKVEQTNPLSAHSFGSVKPLRILIVNSKTDSEILRHQLSESHLPIAEITNVESINRAFPLLTDKNFDVALLALDSSEGHAFEPLHSLNKKHPEVATIVIADANDKNFDLKSLEKTSLEYLISGNYNLETLSNTVHFAVERKRIHKILEKKQKTLETIFDTIPVQLLLVDDKMIVRRINHAVKEFVGREYLQIINRPVGNAIRCVNVDHNEKKCGSTPACQQCPLRNTIKNTLDSGKSVQNKEIQLTLKTETGNIKLWLSINAEPTTIDGHKHIVLALDNITTRKEAEEKLIETMQLKSQFISTVSHELRTPLACIKEGVAIVLDEIVGKLNKKQKHFLDIAKRNIDRLARLINEVLDFQKLDSGTIDLNIHENDINEAIMDVHTTMLPVAGKKRIELRLEPGDKIQKTEFDNDKIIQVLTNLISNAIKFTPENGKVSIALKKREDGFAVSVSDTGMGIPKESLLKIFDRFYRVYRPGIQIQGTGLGLSIVNKIVIMHGGRIDVESEIDQGTTFTVSLPSTPNHSLYVLTEETDKILETTL